MNPFTLHLAPEQLVEHAAISSLAPHLRAEFAPTWCLVAIEQGAAGMEQAWFGSRASWDTETLRCALDAVADSVHRMREKPRALRPMGLLGKATA